MTSNQISAKELEEKKRSNRSQEAETRRSNRAKESNQQRDIETKRYAANVGALSNLVGSAGKIAAAAAANDPKWYNLDQQMVKDVASISYETPLGYGVKPGTGIIHVPTTTSMDNTVVKKINISIPGVVGLEYIPMLGNHNIVRTAALNIYSYVRHANSGSRNYEYQDLIKYLYAVDSIYIGIAELKRIYSILNTYKGYNRFYARGYIQALGYDPASFININLASLRYSVNEMVQSVNALYIPNVMSMYVRHDWMSTGIFKDSPIKRSSNYMFTAKYIYRYNEDVTKKEFGCLTPVTLSTNGTLQGIINRVNECLNVLKNSEDIGIMSGDILKAYGNNNMFMVAGLREDYHIEELYSPEVLSQINAATTFKDIYTPSFYIYEDEKGVLKQGFDSNKVSTENKGDMNISGNTLPLAYAAQGWLYDADATDIEVPEKDLIINMYKDEVTPDDNMVASRLMVATDVRLYPSATNTKYQAMYRVLASGTDMLIKSNYVVFNPDGTLSVLDLYDGRYTGQADGGDKSDVFASMVSCLDWAPRFRQYLVTPNDTNKNITYALLCDNVDLCNYAVITNNDLDRMHRVAVNSELGVPLLGMQVRNK